MTPEEHAIEHAIVVLRTGRKEIGPAAALYAARALIDFALENWKQSVETHKNDGGVDFFPLSEEEVARMLKSDKIAMR